MKQHWHTMHRYIGKKPQDKTPKHIKSNVVYANQCSKEFKDLYIGETKKNTGQMQNRRGNSSEQDSAILLHLKE